MIRRYLARRKMRWAVREARYRSRGMFMRWGEDAVAEIKRIRDRPIVLAECVHAQD